MAEVEWMYQMYSTNNEYLIPNQVALRPLARRQNEYH